MKNFLDTYSFKIENSTSTTILKTLFFSKEKEKFIPNGQNI